MIRWVSFSSILYSILVWLLSFPVKFCHFIREILVDNFNVQAHFQAGIKYKVMPDLQVNFDIGWTDYKVWDEFKFEFDRTISALKIAKILSANVTDSTVA